MDADDWEYYVAKKPVTHIRHAVLRTGSFLGVKPSINEALDPVTRAELKQFVETYVDEKLMPGLREERKELSEFLKEEIRERGFINNLAANFDNRGIVTVRNIPAQISDGERNKLVKAVTRFAEQYTIARARFGMEENLVKGVSAHEPPHTYNIHGMDNDDFKKEHLRISETKLADVFWKMKHVVNELRASCYGSVNQVRSFTSIRSAQINENITGVAGELDEFLKARIDKIKFRAEKACAQEIG